jgi:hypothetical protein
MPANVWMRKHCQHARTLQYKLTLAEEDQLHAIDVESNLPVSATPPPSPPLLLFVRGCTHRPAQGSTCLGLGIGGQQCVECISTIWDVSVIGIQRAGRRRAPDGNGLGTRTDGPEWPVASPTVTSPGVPERNKCT